MAITVLFLCFLSISQVSGLRYQMYPRSSRAELKIPCSVSSSSRGDSPFKPRRESVMGSKSEIISQSLTKKNINEGNRQKNMQYHRKSQEREDKEWRRSDIQTSYTRSNSQRRVYDKARGSLSGQPPRGPQKPGEFTDALADQWQSGRVFQKKGPRGGARRRNDPWWMKEEESNNPRILSPYKPWWFDNMLVDASWKISDLRKEARRRIDEHGRIGSTAGFGGYSVEEIDSMKKLNLVDLLVSLTEQYNLADDGFTSIQFVNGAGDSKPSCYPSTYEGGQEAMEFLVSEAYEQILSKKEE